MQIVSLDTLRAFSAEGMKKVNLFETSRFFLDLYCLEPGQGQNTHSHVGNDKVYLVVEGEGRFVVGADEARLGPGQAVLAAAGEPHGAFNDGPGRLVVLTFMAPHPRYGSPAP